MGVSPPTPSTNLPCCSENTSYRQLFPQLFSNSPKLSPFVQQDHITIWITQFDCLWFNVWSKLIKWFKLDQPGCILCRLHQRSPAWIFDFFDNDPLKFWPIFGVSFTWNALWLIRINVWLSALSSLLGPSCRLFVPTFSQCDYNNWFTGMLLRASCQLI